MLRTTLIRRETPALVQAPSTICAVLVAEDCACLHLLLLDFPVAHASALRRRRKIGVNIVAALAKALVFPGYSNVFPLAFRHGRIGPPAVGNLVSVAVGMYAIAARLERFVRHALHDTVAVNLRWRVCYSANPRRLDKCQRMTFFEG